MSLTFTARLDARGFDVTLDVPAGQTVAVLGPNGAGKSTFVGLVAGLVRADSGRADLAGRTLFDLPPRTRSTRPGGQWLPPHRRGTALLAQDDLLFPHLDVLDNVAFGIRSAGASRRDAAQRAATWLDAVGASPLAHRRPAELSGGQAQRVAVARALATDPQLLLLDEPFAALDAAAAPHLRRLLRTVLADRTTVLVTHDVLDAHALADRVVVLAGGRVVEDGPTRDVLERPQHEFTARLAGLNLLTGVRTAEGIRTSDDIELGLDAEPTGTPTVGSPVAYAFRPSAVSVRAVADGAPGSAPSHPPGSATVRGVLTDIESRGDVVRVGAAGLHADISAEHAARDGLAPGDVVDLRIPRDAALYPALDPVLARGRRGAQPAAEH